MRIPTFLLVGAFVLAGSAQGQSVNPQSDASANAPASAQAGPQRATLAAGTALNATLTSSVDSKKAKAGDKVTAQINEELKSGGETVVPRGAKLIGHLTQATARAKGDAESTLAIQFDKVTLRGGEEVPLNLTIQALAAPPQASAATPDLEPMSPGAGASGTGPGMGSGRGGVGGMAGGAAGTVNNTASTVGNAAGGSVTRAGAAANGAEGGLNAVGLLTADSHGVFGLQGLNLNTAASGAAQGSVITSTGKNVHLDNGTRLLLVAQATTATQK